MHRFNIIGIDLGSNTLRVALMNSSFETLKAREFIVGSARNLRVGGKLDLEAKKRILNALKVVKKEFPLTNNPHIAVATEAFRMASDADELFAYIKDQFDINFRVIKAIDECKFVSLAVKKRLELLGLNFRAPLIVDLGGASTEISFGKIFKSFEFGIIRFYNDYSNLASMMINSSHTTKNAKEFITHLQPDGIILSSGVPTTLAALKLDLPYSEHLAYLVNGISIKFSELPKFRDEVLRYSKEEADYKLGDNRQMLVLAGIILLESLFGEKKEFVVIDDGLREGIMISEILRRLDDI
ncbi:MAG: disulfide bond formation protein DsbA [Campylobacter sp.]|nr:disulfide bond formation protein DsbA [Campylobacter sp.]